MVIKEWQAQPEVQAPVQARVPGQGLILTASWLPVCVAHHLPPSAMTGLMKTR